MNTSVECIHCIIKKADRLFCEYVSHDEKERLEFTKRVLKEISSYDNDTTAPFLYSRVMKILKDKLKIDDLYLKEKKMYNDKILLLENDIWNNITRSDDQLVTALKYAMAGNFIDFGAMDQVDHKLLDEIIRTALRQTVDHQLYEKFKAEIKNARRLSYITDNAGEIVFDKLFIRVIKALNEDLKIDIIVRGEPVLNDVTTEDALEVGINRYGNIIKNGTDIPGTDLKHVNDETRYAIDHSDLIIAKGQGNFETLYGCGKNIYYLFLCKCSMFVKRFNAEKYKAMFLKENDK